MEPRNPHHPGRFSPKILAVIFLAHFSGDIYQSFVAPILPLIKESIGLSLTQVGFVISTTTLAGQLSQPLVGVLADRFGPRTFLLTGLVMGSVLIPLMSITPWYSLILVLGALGALGSSMYHPTAAALVGQFSGARGGLSMSIFGLGGTLGYGFGPLLVTLYISAYGLGHLPYATLPGLVIILSMFFMLPAVERQPKPKTNIIDSIKTGLGDAWRPVMLLWLIGSLRSFADISIRTYYPIMYLDGGESLVSMGVMISLYVLGGSVSSVVCGELVDRKGFKPVFYASFALSTPCLIMFLFSQGWWVYPAGFIGGFILMATMFPFGGAGKPHSSQQPFPGFEFHSGFRCGHRRSHIAFGGQTG